MITETQVSPLAQMIEEKHFSASAISKYRELFQSHPAKMVSLEGLLRSEVVDKISQFLITEAEYVQTRRLYSKMNFVTEDEWSQSPEEDRFFSYSSVTGVRPEFTKSPNWICYLRLNSLMRSRSWLDYLAEISGYDIDRYESARLISHRSGDILKLHNDANPGRVLCMIAYLSPAWRAEDGGNLVMVDKQGTEYPIAPLYNTAIIFDPRLSKHRVDKVAAPLELTRYSYVTWYKD